MPIRVRLPDGSHVNVPTDDPKQAAAAARTYWSKQQAKGAKPKAAPKPKPKAKPKAPPKKSLWQRFQAFDRRVGDYASPLAGEFVDAVLPNWGDEIYAAPRAVGALLRGEDMGEAFDAAQSRYNKRQERFRKRNPKAAAAATVGGTVASVALPAGAAMRGATTAQRARQAGGVGAAYAAVSGAGQGDGIVERGTNAAIQAPMGYAVGAAIPPALNAVQNGTNWARRNVPGVDAAARAVAAVPNRIISGVTGRQLPTAAEEQAHRMLADQMNVGNIDRGMGTPGPAASPQAIAAEVQRRNDMGVPAMVGDVTEPMRGVTSYASRGIGPGQALVRGTLATRKAGEGARVRQHVQETFPTTPDPIQYAEDVTARAKQAAAPLYRKAYEQPMYRDQAIQGIERTPAFRAALPQAFTNIRNQIDEVTGLPKDPMAMGFRWFDGDPNGLPPTTPYFPHPDGNGYVTWDNGLSVEGYDQVIRAMQDAGRNAANVNPVTGAIVDTSNSVHINARARDLRSALTAQNDPYRRAVEGYGDDMTYRTAFQNGSEVGSVTGHEVNALRRSTPEFAQQAWTTGAGTAMADAASQYGAKYPTGNTAAHVRKMLGDDVKQQAISEMGGNTGSVRQLQERLEAENQGHITWEGVNGNSATAQRQQLDRDLDGSLGIPTSAQDAVMRFVRFIASAATPRLQTEIKERIAQVVTASDARTVQEAIAAIEAQAVRDDAFRTMLQRAGISAAALYGHSLQAE